MATKEVKDVPAEERRKRQAVFVKPPKIVLIKILAMGPIYGLERKDRNEATVDARHAIEARMRGLDFRAYRGKGDTGFCLFQKEAGVRITDFVSQLAELGLKYTGGFWQMVDGKGPVNTLQFSLEGEEIPIPKAVHEILGLRFNHCSVWCNLRYAVENGSGQYRLDTINLAKGRQTTEPARELTVSGNTYKLV